MLNCARGESLHFRTRLKFYLEKFWLFGFIHSFALNGTGCKEECLKESIRMKKEKLQEYLTPSVHSCICPPCSLQAKKEPAFALDGTDSRFYLFLYRGDSAFAVLYLPSFVGIPSICNDRFEVV